jgi:PKD repeat protein
MLTVFTRIAAVVWCSFMVLCVVDPPDVRASDRETAIPQSVTASSSIMDALLHGPLLFRENSGQWEQSVLFRTDVSGAVTSFLKDGVSFGFYRNVRSDETSEAGREQLVWNLHFAGSNSAVIVQGEQAQHIQTTYIGVDAGGVRSRSVPSYAQVYYRELYDGIDLKYYGSGEHLKYDYILHPGADVANIRMECNGIAGLYISYNGDLQVMTPWGALTENRPYAYQNIQGEQREVDVRYELLNDTTFGFRIYGAYDTSRALVIDPLSIRWSTFVGGRGTGYLRNIAVDSIGNVYGTGWYTSSFPTTPGVFKPRMDEKDGGNVLVLKLRHDGKALEYATYIGIGIGHAIAVNRKGEAYVIGSEYHNIGESSFPYTASAYQNPKGGNLFALKLNATGTQLQYCARIGFAVASGDDNLRQMDIILDAQEQPVITGGTASDDFPATTFIPPSDHYIGGMFVCKLDNDGQILFSTIIANATGAGIDLTTSGEIVLVGNTRSTDFPVTPGALQSSYRGDPMGDIVVARLDPSATRLLASTYLGGNYWDIGNDIKASASGDIYIAGFSSSMDFPVTPKAYGKRVNDEYITDIVLVKLSNDLSTLRYSTFIGGKGWDYAHEMALNDLGEVYIGGFTTSKDFPSVINSPVIRCGKEGAMRADNVVIKINADATDLLFSFCLGLSNDLAGEQAQYGMTSVALMPGSCTAHLAVAVATRTVTPNGAEFPTTELVFQSYPYNKEFQPAVLMVAEKTEIRAGFRPVVNCSRVEFINVSASTDDGQQLSWLWDFGDGETSVEKNPVHTYAQPGSYKVVLTVKGCEASSTITATVTTGSLVVDAGDDVLVCPRTPVPLKAELAGLAEGTPVLYRWEPAALVDDPSSATPIATPDKSTTFIVTVTTTTGCVAVDSVRIQTFAFPLVDAGPDVVLCKSRSMRIGAMQEATGTYTWTPTTGLDNPSAARPLATPEITTTYILHYSDGRCEGTDTMVVTVHGSLVVDAGRDTTICAGQSVRLGSATEEGTYSWTPVEGLDDPHSAMPVATPGKTTMYVVFHTVGECSGYDTVVVTVLPPALVDAGADTVICTGEVVRLQGRSEGKNFVWSPADEMDDPTSLTPTVRPKKTTTYTLTVHNSLGCISSDQVTVIVEPPVAIGGEKELTICEGDSVVLQAEGGDGMYRWTPQEGLSDAQSARPTASPGKTTRYVVELLNGRCRSSDTVLVHVLPAPNITVSDDATICLGESVELHAQGAQHYEWFPADGLSATDIANPVARPQKTTLYVVQATDDVGCPVRDTVRVTVRQPQQLTISLDEFSAPVGDTLTIPIHVSMDQGTLTIPVLTVRIRYDIRLLDMLGVSAGQTKHSVANEKGILDITLHDVPVSGSMLLTEIHCRSLLTKSTETVLEVEAVTGEKCVQVETRNGKFIRGPICAGGYDVGVLIMPQLQVYPVPAGEQVQVHISDMPEDTRLQLYDLYGKLVLDRNVQARDEQFLTLDVSRLGGGTYTLVARSASATISRILSIVR